MRSCDGSIRMPDFRDANHSWHDGAQRHPTPGWLLSSFHRNNFLFPRAVILEFSGKAPMLAYECLILGLSTTCRVHASCSTMSSLRPPSPATMKIA